MEIIFAETSSSEKMVCQWASKTDGYSNLYGFVLQAYLREYNKHKPGVINDLLGQPTIPAGSDCRLILKFWDGRTLCVKIVMTTGRDYGRPRGSMINH